MIDSALSDERGFFQISLPAGTYSLVVREQGYYYANYFSADLIAPVTVAEGQTSKAQFDVNYQAAY